MLYFFADYATSRFFLYSSPFQSPFSSEGYFKPKGKMIIKKFHSIGITATINFEDMDKKFLFIRRLLSHPEQLCNAFPPRYSSRESGGRSEL